MGLRKQSQKRASFERSTSSFSKPICSAVTGRIHRTPCIGDTILDTFHKVSFAKNSNDFHKELKSRVDAYFDDNNIERHANVAMKFKTLFWLTSAAVCYVGALSGVAGKWGSLALWLGVGFNVACIGFNIGHDAIHNSYSSNKWVNRTLHWTFDIMGACSSIWSLQHNFMHHTYTNIEGNDTDIEPGPFIRLYPQPDRVFWFHRFQHIYTWPLYSFATFAWVFQKDWMMIVTPDPRTGKRPPAKEFLYLLIGKAGHFTLFAVAPLLFTPYAWWEVGIAYAGANMVAGLTLAVVFQLAHVVTGPEFPVESDDDDHKLPYGWAEHQLRTTANFGRGSKLINFVVGGLDHQVEHHLFPKVCHIHYPKIAPIVKETAAEFGIPYHENPSFFGAVASHYRLLKACGKKETAQALVDEQLARQAAEA